MDFLFTLFLGRRTTGWFVEIGAYDGVTFSNTWGLAERGWYGLLVEPVPQFAKQCMENHASHSMVRCVNAAISDGGSETITLRVAGPHSTADASVAEEYATVAWATDSITDDTVTIASMTLDSLLDAEHVPPNFDVLVIDVEGWESKVFAGFSITKWKPKIIIVELADTHPDLVASRVEHFVIGQQLVRDGYGIAYKDSINTVFVRRDVQDAAYGARVPSDDA